MELECILEKLEGFIDLGFVSLEFLANQCSRST